MPLTTTSTSGIYYTDNPTWLSGNLGGTTSTSTGSGIIWTSDYHGTAATGTAYYDTVDNDIRVNNKGVWDSVTSGNHIQTHTHDNVISGDTFGHGDRISISYTTDSNGICISNPYIAVDPVDLAKRRIKEIMRSNLMIRMGNTRQNVLKAKVSPQEIKARQTLRDLITEKQWRGYLTNGFVMIPSLSGKFYQVFNDQRHIKVYSKGKLTDEICIHTDAQECPPSDHILNMMMLIQNDEQILWTKGIGNVYNKDGAGRGDRGRILYNEAGLLVADAHGVILDGDVADREAMRQFVAGDFDAPVTYKASQGKAPSLSLAETYKKLKVA